MKEYLQNLKGWQVVLCNLILFVLYGGICLSEKAYQPLLVFCVIHYLLCTIIGVVIGQSSWILISFVILLIGISTCTGLFFGGLHH
jgi:hypothetical protein